MDLKKLTKRNGQYFYRGKWWKPNGPIPSTRQNKLMMVMAVKGSVFKIVHFGDPDYIQNPNNKQWCSYRSRARGITNAQGELTYKDKFSPNYWSYHYLWPRKSHYKNCDSLNGIGYAIRMVI